MVPPWVEAAAAIGGDAMKIGMWLGPALLLAGCAAGGTQTGLRQSGVPFVSSTGVIEWRVIDSRTLYVKAVTNEWFLVKTMNSCSRMRPATSLGFVTARGTDELDHHGAILAEGQRCPVESVSRAEEPPPAVRG
jgi:hypothetical protein